MARTWIRSASSARTSVKFILLMLAVLLPVGMMLLQLSPKADQIDAASTGCGGKILFAGGASNTSELASTELFDPASNSFAQADQTVLMNSARIEATATLLTVGPNAGKVLIAGGVDNNGSYLSSTEIYDPATNSFAPPNQTAFMNTARAGATATSLTIGPNAGKILIAGGLSFGSLASTELYDPATNSFAPANQTASMNIGREEATATLITNGPNTGKILIAGGFSQLTDSVLNSTEIYDPVANSCAPSDQTATMNSARWFATATVVPTGPNAGKILIAGGVINRTNGGTISASTDLYDPTTNSFAAPNLTATMNSARAQANATVITSGPNAGKILIAGGAGADGNRVASTDLYDPSTNLFAQPNETAAMISPRLFAPATTLETGPNAGKILIVGGGSNSGVLASTEIYDPTTNSFALAAQTPSMNIAREEALAVQLPETGPSPISFVGAGFLFNPSVPVTAVAVGVPSGIQSGDLMLAQIIVYDANATNVPSVPIGWSVIRHDAISGSGGNKMTSWLYYKVAGSSEPTSYTWNISFQYAAGVMRAWRGASVSSPIDQASGSTAVGFNPISVAAPSLTPVTNNELQVYFYGAQAYQAPTITEPSAITERLNEMSAVEGFTTAFGDLAAPPGGTQSPTYLAMATSNIPNGAPPVMTAQAVLLVPLNSEPTPTPTGPVPTPPPTMLPSQAPPPPTPATPFPTPGTTVPRFVASGALTDSAQPLTSVTVSLPSNVISGDLLVAQIAVWDGAGTNVPLAPAGWSSIRDDSVNNANKITSWLYYHLAGGSEPASISWSIASQYAAGVMGDWRGASSSSPIDKSSGTAVAGPSPVSDAAPSLTPANNDELQVYFYGSQSIAAPTIAEPGAITSRANLKSSKEGFTLAFGDLAAPSEGIASPIYAAMAGIPSGTPVLSAQAILLRPGP